MPAGQEGPFVLRVATAGSGSGSVNAQPGGICSSICTAMLARGQRVVLTTQPNPPSVFAGWSGACSGQGTCTVMMDGPKEVTARFDLPEGIVWAHNVPASTALFASGDSIFVGGSAFGSKPIGDRVLEAGNATTPFLAKFDPEGKVQQLKSFPANAVSFSTLAASVADGGLSAAGFLGGATSGARTAQLAKINDAGIILGMVERPNIEGLWNFGSRYLLLGANNGGLEMYDDRGLPIANTQVARPFVIADAAALSDGGWSIGGQFVGMLRLGDRTFMSTAGDWVVARWRADRSVVWAQTSPADKGARIERITTNPAGDLLVAGNFTGQLQLQSQLFQNRGASALFLAKLASANGNVVWGSSISAPFGISCTAITATAEFVYVAVASPGEVTIEGATFRVPGIVSKYDANTGAHLRSVPLDGTVATLSADAAAVYALGAKLWKLQR